MCAQYIVQKRTETHIVDSEPFQVVHREAAHRIRNGFKIKRTELYNNDSIVGYACKVLGKNNLRNMGKINVLADNELEFDPYTDEYDQ